MVSRESVKKKMLRKRLTLYDIIVLATGALKPFFLRSGSRIGHFSGQIRWIFKNHSFSVGNQPRITAIQALDPHYDICVSPFLSIRWLRFFTPSPRLCLL